MSSKSHYGDPATRKRILDAALELAAELGPSMRLADVSKSAGISHQGLYLHFRGRDALIVALLDHMEEVYDFETRYRRVTEAPDALSSLEEFVRFLCELNTRLDAVGWVLEEVQHLDDSFARDYRRRVVGLRTAIEADVAGRLAKEKMLMDGWTTSDAADLILATTTFGAWKDLTGELGWSHDEYTENTFRILRRALVRS